MIVAIIIGHQEVAESSKLLLMAIDVVAHTHLCGIVAAKQLNAGNLKNIGAVVVV